MRNFVWPTSWFPLSSRTAAYQSGFIGEFNDLKAVSEVFHHGDNSILFFDKKMGQPSYSAMQLTGKSVELHKMCC